MGCCWVSENFVVNNEIDRGSMSMKRNVVYYLSLYINFCKNRNLKFKNIILSVSIHQGRNPIFP